MRKAWRDDLNQSPKYDLSTTLTENKLKTHFLFKDQTFLQIGGDTIRGHQQPIQPLTVYSKMDDVVSMMSLSTSGTWPLGVP